MSQALAMNAATVTGIMDWLKLALDWLAKQNLADLAAEVKALYDTCVAALADGKLDFAEIMGIILKFVSLISKVKSAGFGV